MAEGTIIIGSLNDTELKNSIDSLVEKVAQGTKQMKESFDSAIDRMKGKLQELSSEKVDFGSSKRASSQKKERQEVASTTEAYDKLAQATHAAFVAQQNKRYDVSEIQQYRMQLHELEAQMKSLAARAVNTHFYFTGTGGWTDFSDIKKYEALVSGIQAKIKELQALNFKLTREGDLEAARQISYELGLWKKGLESIQNRRGIFEQQQQAATKLQTTYDAIQGKVRQMGADLVRAELAERDMAAAATSAATSTSTMSQAEREAAEQAKIHAQYVKEYSAEARQYLKNHGSYLFAMDRASAMIYPESDSRAKGLTIEQQIESVLKEQEKDYNAISNAERTAVSEAERRLQLQRQVKENLYKAPTTSDAYNRMMARTLGIDVSQVKAAGDSIKSLSSFLTQAQKAYERLNYTERNSAFGRRLRDDIQRTTYELNLLRNQMNRPLSLNIIKGMGESTIEQLTTKIRELQKYRDGLNFKTQKSEINEVSNELGRLKKKYDEVIGANNRMINSNNALTRSWNYMKNRLAFYFTVGASTSFVKNLIEVRSQYELNERALGILIDSAEKGTEIFNELSQMALVSPYTLIELSAAAKQLVAYDVAARDVVDTTRRLADMASAVGVPMERLTYALGQIKAYGYLNSRDNRMFANAGIPLVKQLSEYYTEFEGRLISTADVYDRIKKKAVGYEDVMNVIYRMTDEGGKFFDFQAKMADTLKVRLANLTLAWNNMLNEMGKEQQGLIVSGIGLLRKLFLHWKDISKAINNVIIPLGALKALQLAYWALTRNTTMAIALESVVGNKLAGVFRNIGASLTKLMANPLTWWTLLASAVFSAVSEIARGNEVMKEFNRTIREGAEDGYKNISEYLEQYAELRKSLYKTEYNEGAAKNMQTPVDISDAEARKAWEAMREQIELVAASSNVYIGELLQIENISQRLRFGFSILEDLKEVDAALKDINDNTFKVTKNWSAWWNLGLAPEGLIQNVKDYAKSLKEVSEAEQDAARNSLGSAGIDYGTAKIEAQSKALQQLKGDLDESTQSINEFIAAQGFADNPTQVGEVYDKYIKKLTTDNNLDPSEGFAMQQAFEAAKSQAMREALQARIEYERSELAAAINENSKMEIQKRIETLQMQQKIWSSELDDSRIYWNDFTSYLKDRHISEIQQMYNEMGLEYGNAIDLQSKEWQDAVQRWVTGYARSHKMSYDSAFGYLKKWVETASNWEVFLRLVISTEGGKSVYEMLNEYDGLIDDADGKIKRLEKRIDELKKKSNKSVKEITELVKAESELADAQKQKADAEEKGGHGKQEEKDAKAAAKEAEKQRKAAERERKKQEREAARAQKQAETELQKTLKNELSLIDKIRSSYQALTKEGMSHTAALEMSTTGFAASVNEINKVFAKWGIDAFDAKKFAGISNPRELVNLLQRQLDVISGTGRAKPQEIQDLQVKIKELRLDAEKYDLKKIKDGLNNELGRLTESYELALELDENPELGESFADLMGINPETLPHDMEEYSKLVLKYLNKYLKDVGANIELPTLLLTNDDLKAFEQMVKENKLNESVYETIKKTISDVREKRKKDISDTIKGWQELLEKYSEYEYKRAEIARKAEKERQKARKANAPKWILDSIDERERREIAELDFAEFQKLPTWVAATGDVAKLSDEAIKILIKRLKEYKVQAKNLDPKQIQKINKALRQLYKQQRANNPFHLVSDAISDAKDRFDEYQIAIDDVADEIAVLMKAQKDNGQLDERQAERLKNLIKLLKRLQEEQEEVGKVSVTEIVEGINGAINVAKQAAGAFSEMAEALGGHNMSNAAKNLSNVVGIMEKAGSYALIGAQLGGGYGAAIGAALGVIQGVLTTYMDEFTGNAAITRRIESSENVIKRLELSYIDLQHAIDKAYGTGIIGAQKLAAENKKAQLAELKYQLKLEYSRKTKNRDMEKIIELQKEIRELEYEISGMVDDVVNALLGISSVGDAMENLMDSFVEALRSGEDAMATFNDSIDEMIANMVKKMFTTKILQPWFEQQWDAIQKEIDSRGAKYYEEMEAILEEKAAVENYDGAHAMFFEQTHGMTRDEYLQKLSNRLEELQNLVLDESGVGVDDIRRYAELLRSGQPIMEENMAEIRELLISLGLMKSSANSNLSALQQGIQGITEDTAGALEAYMNSVSQQVYLHSDLLLQIRDLLVSYNADVQTATIGQILLQLQASYQTQNAIHAILDGWSSPNGQSVKVELLN